MIKIDIISGFLGAGKTTLIKKLLKEALQGQKVALIENEFGEIGIDGGFLKEAGIEIREMNSGCICCSLVGDFGASLQEVIEKYAPDRILIEPSGVGKLSDVIKAVEGVRDNGSALNSAVAVVDAVKCRMYLKNFGEFFINQIENAGTIILSRVEKISEEKVKACVDLIREHNETAPIITTPWEQLEGETILQAVERKGSLEQELLKQMEEKKNAHNCRHDHHNHEEESCGCGHHHDHEEESCGCDHHHDHEEESCGCGHHHDHEEESRGHGRHHHADEVFESWGLETPVSFREEELRGMLNQLNEEERFGMVLRAKGMVKAKDGEEWIYFDFVPEEMELRTGKPEYTGKICVIGSQLKKDALQALFQS